MEPQLSGGRCDNSITLAKNSYDVIAFHLLKRRAAIGLASIFVYFVQGGAEGSVPLKESPNVQ